MFKLIKSNAGNMVAVDETGFVKNPETGYVYTQTKTQNGYIIAGGDYVHRLVAKAFIPLIEGKNCVNHIDGVKTNNHTSNLEWCTHSENSRHSVALGLQKQKEGEAHPWNVYPESLIHEICQMIQDGRRNKDIATRLGVSRDLVGGVKMERNWKHITSQYNFEGKAHRGSLSENTVKWICNQLQDKVSMVVILREATSALVTYGIIKNIKKRKSYKDISVDYTW